MVWQDMPSTPVDPVAMWEEIQAGGEMGERDMDEMDWSRIAPARDPEGFRAELDAMVIDAGGRVYLGKDAFLRAGSLAQMYPRLDEWRAIKARVDPDEVFRSHLSSRVGLTR